MADSANTRAWGAPDVTASVLLRALSDALHDDLVIWMVLHDDVATVEVLHVVDPLPEAQVVADRLPRGVGPSAGSIVDAVAAHGSTVTAGPSELRRADFSSLPASWRRYIEAFPLRAVTVVPQPIDDVTTGVLLVGRRDGPVHRPDEVVLAERAAQRLVGIVPPQLPPGPERASSIATRRATSRSVLAWLLAVVGPLAVAAAYLPLDDPSRLRPVAGFLLICVVVAIVGTAAAAATCAVMSTLALWWAVTPRQQSFVFESAQDIVGTLLFAVSTVGVVVLVHRVDLARRRMRVERDLRSVVLDQVPVSVALFDGDLRFSWVNSTLAGLHGTGSDDHVGRSVDEISPWMAQLLERHLLAVRDTGRPLHDVHVRAAAPEVGFDRHWIADFLPWDDPAQRCGVLAVLRDVTDDVIERERATALLSLTERLSMSFETRDVADAVCEFLVTAYRGRSLVALREDGCVTIEATGGFDEHARAWIAGALLEGDSPVLAALDESQPVVSSAPQSSVPPSPTTVGPNDPGWLDWDSYSVVVPIPAGAMSEGGAVYLGWASGRPIDEELLTSLRTVASLAALAIERLHIQRSARDVEFQGALDAMIDNVAIARAIRDDDGDIVDFRLAYVNAHSVDGAGRTAADLIGARVCELYPDWRSTGLFDRFARVVETGEPFTADRLHYEGVDDCGTPIDGWWSLQVAKFDDGYIAASRDVTSFVESEIRIREAEELARAERTATELLQAAALPATLPDIPGLQFAARYVPGDDEQPVGGDWYDAFLLDEHRIALVIADVAGHGRAAASFMLQVRNVFRAIAVEHGDPGEVLSRANRVTLQLNEADGPFVTCCYAVLDTQRLTLRYSLAGHFAPARRSPLGPSCILSADPGPPLAFFRGAEYRTSQVQLVPGDRVVLFTDGVVERPREDLALGLRRLCRELDRHDDLDAGAMLDAVVEGVRPGRDDLAMLCIDVARTRNGGEQQLPSVRGVRWAGDT